MDRLHRWVAFVLVGTLLLFWIRGGLARLRKKRDPGDWYWHLLAVTQVAVGLQALIGVGLLLVGRIPSDWLHLVYGLGPAVVFAGAHLYARRAPHERYPYAPFLIAGLVSWGLAVRALMTGLGLG